MVISFFTQQDPLCFMTKKPPGPKKLGISGIKLQLLNYIPSLAYTVTSLTYKSPTLCIARYQLQIHSRKLKNWLHYILNIKQFSVPCGPWEEMTLTPSQDSMEEGVRSIRAAPCNLPPSCANIFTDFKSVLKKDHLSIFSFPIHHFLTNAYWENSKYFCVQPPLVQNRLHRFYWRVFSAYTKVHRHSKTH